MFKMSKSRYNPRLIWTVYSPCCTSSSLPADCCIENTFHDQKLPGGGVMGPAVSFTNQRDVFGLSNPASAGRGGGGYSGGR